MESQIIIILCFYSSGHQLYTFAEQVSLLEKPQNKRLPNHHYTQYLATPFILIFLKETKSAGQYSCVKNINVLLCGCISATVLSNSIFEGRQSEEQGEKRAFMKVNLGTDVTIAFNFIPQLMSLYVHH